MGEYIDQIKKSKKWGKVFKIFMLEVLLLLLIIAGMYLWREAIYDLNDNVKSITTEMNAFGDLSTVHGVELTESLLKEIYYKLILSFFALVIYLVLVWLTLKYIMYNIVFNRKYKFKDNLRFLVVGGIDTVVFVVLFFVIQYLGYIFLSDGIVSSNLARFLLFALLSIGYFVLYWFSVLFYFTYYDAAGEFSTKGIKKWSVAFWQGTTRFHKILVPMLFSFLKIIGITVIMYFFASITVKNVFVIITTLILMFFISWLKIYYAETIRSLFANSCNGVVNSKNNSQNTGENRVLLNKNKKRNTTRRRKSDTKNLSKKTNKVDKPLNRGDTKEVFGKQATKKKKRGKSREGK